MYIEPGEYTYRFELFLPDSLPSSFEHKNGRIRYWIKCVLEIPDSLNKETIRTFSVINPYDLNCNQDLKSKTGTSDKTEFCCGPCKSGPIDIKFYISKSGYVPGENILCNVIFDNKSNRDVEEWAITLIQTIKIQAKNAISQFARNVARIKSEKKAAKNKLEKWENKALRIPSVCSSTHGVCKLIDVSYQLRLNYKVSGKRLSDTDLTIPIKIGTIPIFADKIPTMSIMFKMAKFETEPFVDKAIDKVSNVEIVENDSINFRPLYPFYDIV